MEAERLEEPASPCILAVFAKQPMPGEVKTRLAAQVNPDWAAVIAEAFLCDTLQRLASMPVKRMLVITPALAGEYFSKLGRAGFYLARQADGNLGQRLETFFREQFESGARAVVAVGSDSPTMPTHFVEQAFQCLGNVDVVIGPATDGGYYLLGCSRLIPELFRRIDWGASTVLRDTVAALGDPGIRLNLLPPWYDVDTLDDWRMLHGHVSALRRAGLDPGVPHTERLLQTGIR
jgi:rSAM/selenodomain-associated transferase 1